jgi:hypothetical protein
MDYLQQKRNELNFKKINTIQQFIVSLTDRITTVSSRYEY